MTEKECMLSEQLYIGKDEELMQDYYRARKLTRLINATTEEQPEERVRLMRELFGSVGKNPWLELSFHTDFGCHTYIGDNFYANYDCIILDIADVRIGDNVFFGPRVSLFTAGHPIDAGVRNSQLEYGKKITIGNDVWVGGNTVINPGITVGSNVVIGSGSVVTKNIPDGVIACGNPCRVVRKITEADRVYWEQQAEIHRRNRES